MEKSNLYSLCRSVIGLMIKNIQPLLAELELYPGQEIFLTVIGRQEGITSIELASLLDRKRSTITKAIQSLEHGGFIKREMSSFDKRKYYLFLTEKGKKACLKLEKLGNTIMTQYDNIMTREEHEVIISVLEKMIKELKKEG